MSTITFRDVMEDNTRKTIRLSTSDGMMGYRIKKFQAVGTNLGTSSHESVFQLWKVSPEGILATIDFSDSNLLAVVYWGSHGDVRGQVNTVIFDNEIFNQDIYITHQDVGGDSASANFYLELEKVPLNKNSQSVVTLKDIRANE